MVTYEEIKQKAKELWNPQLHIQTTDKDGYVIYQNDEVEEFINGEHLHFECFVSFFNHDGKNATELCFIKLENYKGCRE